MVELDHIFICVDDGAPEGDALVERGWSEGAPNIHVELGTANRRFYAHNFMLELLYVRDAAVLQNPDAALLGLYERLTTRAGSPFGVCLRCEAPDEPLPFDTVPRKFAFLPDHVTARIPVDAQDPATPATFCLSGIARPELYPAAPPLDHEFGGRYLTRSRLTLPAPGAGRSLAGAAGAGHIELAAGPESLLELWFDDGDTPTDFTRRGLPLVVYSR